MKYVHSSAITAAFLQLGYRKCFKRVIATVCKDGLHIIKVNIDRASAHAGWFCALLVCFNHCCVTGRADATGP